MTRTLWRGPHQYSVKAEASDERWLSPLVKLHYGILSSFIHSLSEHYTILNHGTLDGQGYRACQYVMTEEEPQVSTMVPNSGCRVAEVESEVGCYNCDRTKLRQNSGSCHSYNSRDKSMTRIKKEN